MSEEIIIQNGADEAEKAGESSRALRGKIARLPKAVREKLNRRLDNGEPASTLVDWLNGLPTVKRVLAAHFGGEPINEMNISRWRCRGYQRWVKSQEYLSELKEFVEEAAVINRTSGEGLLRSTATVASTKLLKMLHDIPPEKCVADDPVKIAFAIAALNNVDRSHVQEKHEERRMEQKDEMVTLAWDKHLRNCAAIGLRLLGDAQAKAVQKAPINNEAKIELIGRRMFGKLWRGRRVGAGSTRGVGSTHGPIAGPDEGTNGTDGADGGGQSPPVLNSDEPSLHSEPIKQRRSAGHACRAPLRSGEGEQPQRNAKSTKSCEENSEALGGTPDATRETRVLPISVGEGEQPQRNTKITKSGEADAQEDTRVMRPATIQVEEKTFGEAPNTTREARVVPKPGLSDYEKAIVEGKTPLEAMYAQFTRPKDPPPQRQPIPEPPYRYYAMSRQPDPQRPPPEWNSLG